MITNAIKLTGLIILTGSPLFYAMVIRQLNASELADSLRHQTIRLTIIAGGLYVLSSLVSGILAYYGTHQFTLSAEYLNLILVPAFITCFLQTLRLRKAYLSVCTFVLGLALLLIHSTTSHAAGLTGWLPFISDLIHLIAAAIWGGGTIYFACLLYTVLRHYPDKALPNLRWIAFRFSNMAIVSLIVMLVSGAVLTVSNVHSTAALDSTLYGTSLKIKLLFVIFLLCLLIYDLLKTSPGLKKITVGVTDIAHSFFAHYRKLVLSMSFMVLLVTIATGVMVKYTPPDTAPFLTPQSWTLNAGQYPVRIDVQPVAGSVNNVRFELYLPDVLMQQPGTLVNYSLYIPESSIGVKDVEAIQVSQNSFQGEATFPMPGSWRLELELYPPGGNQLSGVYNFELPSLPLVEDLRTYLSLSSIVYSPANKITFIVGIFLIMTYGWLTWRSQSGQFPRWITILGLVSISIGIFLVMSVTLVKTYPSTYWQNPQSYTAMSVNAGQAVYMESCAECHGDTGVGDGPWAIENRGMIPSLVSPHMDIHTDGEIYWWITYGIPSLDMPPLESELTEDRRWQSINFVRSLRHGIPN